MKGKRAHKADGGINGKTGGTDDAEMDEKTKPERRTASNKIDDEAEELKKGGRAKRKSGGKTEVSEKGEMPKMHAGRKARKSGGGCESSPFSSARKGTPAPGRKEMMESDG